MNKYGWRFVVFWLLRLFVWFRLVGNLCVYYIAVVCFRSGRLDSWLWAVEFFAFRASYYLPAIAASLVGFFSFLTGGG